jgi:hypothetical protein
MDRVTGRICPDIGPVKPFQLLNAFARLASAEDVAAADDEAGWTCGPYPRARRFSFVLIKWASPEM